MNKELTPAEIVAVKLLGWKPYTDNDEDYQHFRIFSDGKPWCSVCDLPDFTDERLSWYWIRRVEDALRERKLLMEYYDALRLASFGFCDSDVFWEFRATVPQRLEAAIRVIEEAGL